MLLLSYIQTADSTLPVGRFDSALLSDQERLEILVSNFEDKALESFREPTGDYLPVCDWLGVQCDAYENVTAIDWEDWDGVHGDISLDLLPKKLKKLRIGKFLYAHDAPRLRGTLSTALLPPEICVLDIEDQNFSGPVDFTSFPAKVTKVNISQNKFCGKAEFHELPPDIESLLLSWNHFMGSVQLDKLPESLTWFALGSNKFCGEVDLAHLPKNMKHLDLNSNAFTGSVCLSNLPPSMVVEGLYLQGNWFEPVHEAKIPTFVYI